MKKTILFTLILIICWAVGLASLVPAAQAITLNPGDLIKASLPAVYYYSADGKRYVFPNQQTYMTWYNDFSAVKTITDAELAAIMIGGNVTYRPGVKMVKITTDPKVYTVAANGTLRWIQTESTASCLYGSNWASMIEDVADAFFINYTVGSAITDCGAYNPAAEQTAATSIDADKGKIQPTQGALSVTLASDTPAGQTVAAGTELNFTKIRLSAGSSALTINSIYVTRYGLSSNSDLTNIKFVKTNNEIVSGAANLGSSSKALLTFSPALTINANSWLDLYIKATIASSAASAKTMALGIAQASDISLAAGTVSGGFPVVGNYMGTPSVSTPVLPGLSLPDGILIAGRTNQGVASFKLTASKAEDVDLNSITITDIGTGKVAEKWYLYAEKRDDGLSINEPVAIATMSSATKKAKFILPTNTVIIPDGEHVTFYVRVDAVSVDGLIVQNGDSLKAEIVNAADVAATGKASGQKINGTPVTDSDMYYVLASYPYFELDAGSPSGALIPGSKTLLAVFKVTADPADEIDFYSAALNSTSVANKLTVNIAHSCTPGIGSGLILQDDKGNVLDTQAVDVCNANSVTFTFGNPQSLAIAAGNSKKLYVYADTRGASSNGDSIQLFLDDSNAANLDFAIDGSGNYQFAQYIFKGVIYANPLVKG